MRRLTSFAATALLLASLSGCGGAKSADPGPLELSDSPTPSSDWSAGEQQVIDGYLKFRTVFDRGARGEPLDLATFRSVATEPFASKTAQALDSSTAAGIVLQGDGLSAHPQKVAVSGTTATIELCLDARTMHYVNTTATPPANVDVGAPIIAAEAKLTKSGDTWLVARQDTTKHACTTKDLT